MLENRREVSVSSICQAVGSKVKICGVGPLLLSHMDYLSPPSVLDYICNSQYPVELGIHLAPVIITYSNLLCSFGTVLNPGLL